MPEGNPGDLSSNGGDREHSGAMMVDLSERSDKVLESQSGI